MDEAVLFVALTSGLILVTGILYEPIQRSLVTEPLIAVALGIAVGPVALHWMHPERWEASIQIVRQLTHHLLAVALMAAALRLPHRYPRDAARSQLLLVFGGMVAMTVVSASVFWLVLDLPVLPALALGAMVAPTDPVLATTVVTGHVAERNVPARIRHLITGESGANDCLALPFVLLPVLLLQHGQSGWTEWLRAVLYENVLAIALGITSGRIARRALHYGFEHHDVSSKAFLSYALALALFTLSGLELLHMNGLLGVFAAGVTFNYGLADREEATSERIQEAIERLFVVPGFILFGVLLPWDGIAKLGWRAALLAALILLLRRLPVLLLLRPVVPELRTRADAAFVGWFGPIGVAALYYASKLHGSLPGTPVWEVVCVVVLASVLVHGVTCSPLGNRYRAFDEAHRLTGPSSPTRERHAAGAAVRRTRP